MNADVLVRYFHFLSILALFAALAGQFLFVRPSMTRRESLPLQNLDIIYGIASVGVLVTGLLQWFAVGKPASFYSPNPLFHAKLMLFLIIGLLSIYPSVFLAKQRKGDPEDTITVPPLVLWSIRAEIALLLAMPLLATLMARGVGLSSE